MIDCITSAGEICVSTDDICPNAGCPAPGGTSEAEALERGLGWATEWGDVGFRGSRNVGDGDAGDDADGDAGGDGDGVGDAPGDDADENEGGDADGAAGGDGEDEGDDAGGDAGGDGDSDSGNDGKGVWFPVWGRAKKTKRLVKASTINAMMPMIPNILQVQSSVGAKLRLLFRRALGRSLPYSAACRAQSSS